jgi:hypothetical protein
VASIAKRVRGWRPGAARGAGRHGAVPRARPVCSATSAAVLILQHMISKLVSSYASLLSLYMPLVVKYLKRFGLWFWEVGLARLDQLSVEPTVVQLYDRNSIQYNTSLQQLPDVNHSAGGRKSDVVVMCLIFLSFCLPWLPDKFCGQGHIPAYGINR